MNRMKFSLAVTTMLALAAPAFETRVRAQDAPVQALLSKGDLEGAISAMKDAVEQNPNDQQARFSLGAARFLRAVEGLGQDHWRYGLLGERRPQITFMRLPIPENNNPQRLSYNKARAILQDMVDRLALAELALAEMEPGDVKLPLAVGQIRFDFNMDGTGSEDESLWAVMNAMRGPRRGEQPPATNDIRITFDAGDVYWLRGYCHALSGLAEVFLAYDWSEQFHHTAHLFYPNVETPYAYLADEGPGFVGGFNTQNILDVIALIHTTNYECKEPDRMRKALSHFESVIAMSRLSWEAINAETDNDNEWIPNVNQESAIGGMRVGREIATRWHELLDEVEAILLGKKLIPFWRGVRGGVPLFINNPRDIPTHPELGINVRKIFTEPQRFDLVLWLQGPGLHPFLEKGDRTKGETWMEIADAFGDEFLLFFFWFN